MVWYELFLENWFDFICFCFSSNELMCIIQDFSEIFFIFLFFLVFFIPEFLWFFCDFFCVVLSCKEFWWCRCQSEPHIPTRRRFSNSEYFPREMLERRCVWKLIDTRKRERPWVGLPKGRWEGKGRVLSSQHDGRGQIRTGPWIQTSISSGTGRLRLPSWHSFFLLSGAFRGGGPKGHGPPSNRGGGEKKPILPPLIICFWIFFKKHKQRGDPLEIFSKNISKGGTLWKLFMAPPFKSS